jgi:hypothetical protein
MEFVIKAVCSQGHNPKVHILRERRDLKDNKTFCGIETTRSWDVCKGPSNCLRCFSRDSHQASAVGCK